MVCTIEFNLKGPNLVLNYNNQIFGSNCKNSKSVSFEICLFFVYYLEKFFWVLISFQSNAAIIVFL